MTDDTQRQADIEMVKAHCNQLSEHFDTVQIFVSRHMPAELEGTRTINFGAGNWYARYGQVVQRKIASDERERIAERKDNEESEG